MSPHPCGPPSIGGRRNSLSRLQVAGGSSSESVARFNMRRSARLPARNARADSAGNFNFIFSYQIRCGAEVQ